MKLVVSVDDTGAGGALTLHMDCPLCVPMLSNAPTLGGDLFYPTPWAHVLRPIAQAPHALATAPPLPGRGPPALG